MRMTFLDPEEALDKIEIKPDMTASDFGCGSGGFSIPLAKRVQDGIVYALDVQEPPLEALKSRASMEGVLNINVIRCNLESPRSSGIPDISLDLVTIVNVFFQIEKKEVVLEEARRVLKSGGRILVIEWNPDSSKGPVVGRVSSEEIIKMGEKSGFTFKEEFSIGDYHYGVILEKP